MGVRLKSEAIYTPSGGRRRREKIRVMIKVLIVDDQVRVCEGLQMRLRLEPDIEIVGWAADGLEALRQVRALQPQVVIMDVEMPRMDGIMAAAALTELFPRCAVIIHSLHDDAGLRERAREAGAVAFVPKQSGDAALLAAIRTAAGQHQPGKDEEA